MLRAGRHKAPRNYYTHFQRIETYCEGKTQEHAFILFFGKSVPSRSDQRPLVLRKEPCLQQHKSER